MADSTSQQDVAKVYTGTRRFPQLIGKTTDGKQIPGGPYTLTQFFGAFVLAYVLWKSMALWTTSNPILDWALVLLGTGVGVFALGKVPLAGRNPFSVVAGFTNAASSTAPRSVGGRIQHRRRPHPVRTAVQIQAGAPTSAVAPPEEAVTRSEALEPTDTAGQVSDAMVEQEPASPQPSEGLADPQSHQPDDADTVPHLVALAGGVHPDPERRPAAQTSVETLLSMALKKEA